MSGAVAGLPGKFPVLNCFFRISSTSSMPLMVVATVWNRLKPEHRPNPLFDSAMILLHDVVQVLAGSYPNTARYHSR